MEIAARNNCVILVIIILEITCCGTQKVATETVDTALSRSHGTNMLIIILAKNPFSLCHG